MNRRAIHKYHLRDIENIFLMPVRGQVVKVADDPTGKLCIWMLFDTDDRTANRTFQVVMTGEEVESSLEYVGSTVKGQLVLHIFEKKF